MTGWKYLREEDRSLHWGREWWKPVTDCLRTCVLVWTCFYSCVIHEPHGSKHRVSCSSFTLLISTAIDYLTIPEITTHIHLCESSWNPYCYVQEFGDIKCIITLKHTPMKGYVVWVCFHSQWGSSIGTKRVGIKSEELYWWWLWWDDGGLQICDCSLQFL